MNKLQELLAKEGRLLLDGAMGTMLMVAGLEQGAPPEEWNVNHPDRVQAVWWNQLSTEAAQFAGSGSRVKSSSGGQCPG